MTSQPAEQRLGIFVENAYLITESEGGDRIHSHSIVYAFALFACEVGRHFRTATFFGRSRRGDPDVDYHPLPADVRLVELPFYRDLTRLGELVRAMPRSATAVWRGLDDVDVVWVLGPHPFSFLVLVLAALRRKRIVLGVRQDTVPYYSSRLRTRVWRVAMPAVWAMDTLFRALARRLPTAVVGSELARRYSRRGGPAFSFAVSLIRAADVPRAVPLRRDGALEHVRLLTVARVEPEKNPLLIVDALAQLERRHPCRFSLTWAGDGKLLDDLRARAEAEGLASKLHLPGYVAFGPELLELYRSADVFVHVALTEGLPQALVEALGCGLPVVATDVGGVAEALGGGVAGLLVQANDVTALADAIVSLVDDATTRRSLVENGVELARASTLEVEAERVARFIAGG